MQYDHEQKSVKKPKDEVEMTDEQAQEFEKCALDFYYWCENYAYVQGDGGKTIFKPRPYQERMIDSFLGERFTCVLSSRQSGKCVGKNTKYTVRHKETGEIYELTAEEFHTLVKDERDCGEHQ